MPKKELVAFSESGYIGTIVDIRDTSAGKSIPDKDLALYASLIEMIFLTYCLYVRVVDHPDRYFYPVVLYEENGAISYFAVGLGGLRIVESDMREILDDIDISPVGGRFGEPQVEYIISDQASYFQISFTPRPQAPASDYYDLSFD